MLANDSEKIILFDSATSKVIRTFTGHSRDVSSLAFAPDGRTAVSASWDHTLKLWNTDAGH
jgi:WD40 repeat protein